MRRRGRDEDEAGRATLAPGMLAVPNVKLTRKIAEGGMGSVWEGQHLALRTTVAVKFVLAELGENDEAATRFEREATSAARIKSPHVVQVLDHGLTENEGVPYIVMELLEGEDLEARLRREPRLPLELVAHLIGQASKALTRAHSLGIVHRDIKPSNVYLTDVGGETFVKLLDFGIAKLMMNDVGRARVTQTGAMLGTPIFMSPEQMTHAKDVGPGADLWSLGVVAYLALLGRLPFDEDTIAGIAMAIERGVFPAPTSLMPNLPKAIDEWFAKIFKKDPKERFATAKDMADGLARIAQMPLSPASLSHTSTPPPPGSEEVSVEDEPTHVEDAGKIEKKLAEAFGIETDATTEVAKRGAPRPTAPKAKTPATAPLASSKEKTPQATPLASSTPTEAPKTPTVTSVIVKKPDAADERDLPAVARTNDLADDDGDDDEKTHAVKKSADAVIAEVEKARRITSSGELADRAAAPPSSTPPPPIFDNPGSKSEPPQKGPSTVMGVSGGDADLPTGKRSNGKLYVGVVVALGALAAGAYAVVYMNAGGAPAAPSVTATSLPLEPSSNTPNASTSAPPSTSAEDPNHLNGATSAGAPSASSSAASPKASASAASSAHAPPPVHSAPPPAHSATSPGAPQPAPSTPKPASTDVPNKPPSPKPADPP